MKQLLVTLFVITGIFTASLAHAQEFAADRADLKDLRSSVIEDRKAALETKAELKADLRAEAEAKKAELKAQFDAATTDEEKQSIREAAAVERDALKEKAEEYREEWREKVKEYFRVRVRLVFERVDLFIAKAESADARITNVIETLQAQGIDTSAVEEQLAEAEQLVSDAEIATASIKSNLEAAVETGSKEEIRTVFNESKAQLQEVQRELKSAFANIRAAIAELKKLAREQNTTAASATDATTDVE